MADRAFFHSGHALGPAVGDGGVMARTLLKQEREQDQACERDMMMALCVPQEPTLARLRALEPTKSCIHSAQIEASAFADKLNPLRAMLCRRARGVANVKSTGA